MMTEQRGNINISQTERVNVWGIPPLTVERTRKLDEGKLEVKFGIPRQRGKMFELTILSSTMDGTSPRAEITFPEGEAKLTLQAKSDLEMQTKVGQHEVQIKTKKADQSIFLSIKGPQTQYEELLSEEPFRSEVRQGKIDVKLSLQPQKLADFLAQKQGVSWDDVVKLSAKPI